MVSYLKNLSVQERAAAAQHAQVGRVFAAKVARETGAGGHGSSIKIVFRELNLSNSMRREQAGFAQLQLCAAQGLDAAQFELGRCYRFGYGVAVDDKQALRLYRLAADAAFPDAFESLAELAADVDEEIYWLERSVAAGRAVGSKLKSTQKKREKTMSFGLG